MLIVALAIFVTMIGAFTPTLVNLYLQYVKEPTAPEYIRIYPYQIPVVGMIVMIALSGGFLIYAAIKEQRKKQKVKSDMEILKEQLDTSREQLNGVEERLNDIERRTTKIE